MALCGNLGRCAVQVYPDQHLKLVCRHENFSALGQVPQRCGAPDNHRPNVIKATHLPVLGFCRGPGMLGVSVKLQGRPLFQLTLHNIKGRFCIQAAAPFIIGV
jgi:hypothetical protein